METLITNLTQALAATLQANQEIRKQAEEYINQVQKQQGYVTALLEISADSKIDSNVCLAAAVQLGNMVEYHWKFRDETHAKEIAIVGFNFIVISEQEKQSVRQHFVQRMYEQTNKVVIKQYSRCITTICRFDYPERWPTLLSNDIPGALNSQNEKGIYTGLLSLFSLVKKYEYEMDQDREPLYTILDKSFSILGALINQLLNHTQNEIALQILHLICKVFYVANQLLLAPALTQPGALDPWMGFFKTLMDQDLPQQLTSFTENQEEIIQRDKTIQWKIKAVAAKITYRLFSKYGNPVYSQDDYKKFSKQFQEKFSELLLESHLMLMFARKTQFVGSKCLNFVIKYISSATKLERTMVKLKPYMDSILYETVIPIMLPTEKDIQLFSDDPIEYVRKQQDFTETLYMPRNTVIDLLQYVVQYKSNKKGQPDYLIPFLNYAVTNMNTYNQHKIAGQNPDWRIKEALLCAIGHLRSKLEDLGEQFIAQLETLLITHVLPELKSPYPFLRLRACWMYGEFGDYEFKDQDHVKHAVDGVYQQLFTQELPVRLAAANALSHIVKIKTAEEFLKPALKQILETYLKLMSEIESEELVQSLETFMKIYSDHMAPYALQICDQLVQQYRRLIKFEDEDETGESMLAAVGCVTAIRRVLDAVSKDQQLLLQLQPVVMPLMMHGLTPDGLDAIEDAVDCITLLIYYGKSGVKITPEMWQLFPQMLYITGGKPGDVDGGFAFEQLAQVIVAVQNYIQKDPETFLTVGNGQQITYLEHTFQFMRNVLLQNQSSKNKLDGISVLKLFICIFENLPNKIDHALGSLVGTLLAELHAELNKKKPVKNYISMLLQTISVAFFNNSDLTFQTIVTNNMLVSVFQNWLKFMPQFTKEFELRRVIFGLACVLRSQNLPQMVFQQIGEMGKVIVELVQRQYKIRMDTLLDNEKHLDESSSDESFEDEQGSDMEDGDNDEQDFKETKAKLAKFANGEMDDQDDPDDSDYEFQSGDMQLYDSALDEIDELIFMKQTLDGLFQHNSQYYNQIVIQVQGDQLNEFMQCLGNAQQLKDREAKCVDAYEMKDKQNGGRDLLL